MKITCYFFTSIILKYVSVKYSAVLDVKLKMSLSPNENFYEMRQLITELILK